MAVGHKASYQLAGGLFESAAWCNPWTSSGTVSLQGFVGLSLETTGLHHKNNIVTLLRLEKKKVNLNKTSRNITIITILPTVSPLKQPYQLLEILMNLKIQNKYS